MKPEDYAPFLAQLDFMRDQAEVWEAMARAYWTTKLAQKGRAPRGKAMTMTDAFALRLATLQNSDAPEFAATQRASGGRLVEDLRTTLTSIK